MGERMNSSLTGRLAAAASLAALCLAPALADAPTGIQWETTSQMVMPGMPFSPPKQTLKICTKPTWSEPPPGGDPTCVASNYQRVGKKVTWTMQCSGQMPMTGTGEINYNDDESAYTGVITASADGMDLTIQLTGKKLGTCNNPR
jgi:hypothetical protein